MSDTNFDHIIAYTAEIIIIPCLEYIYIYKPFNSWFQYSNVCRIVLKCVASLEFTCVRLLLRNYLDLRISNRNIMQALAYSQCWKWDSMGRYAMPPLPINKKKSMPPALITRILCKPSLHFGGSESDMRSMYYNTINTSKIAIVRILGYLIFYYTTPTRALYLVCSQIGSYTYYAYYV